MHFFHYFILSMSAGALALPTNNSSSLLEKRGNYGWITTYAPNDKGCHGGYDTRSRPKLDGTCQIWEPSTNNIGVNFGTYPLSLESVVLYSDLRCMNQVDKILPDKGRNLGFTTKANHGPNVCTSFDRTKILSVQALGVGDADPL